MAIHLSNFFNSQNRKSKMGDFQDLEHVDGISISTTSANLYNNPRDDLVMFYFREGANYASVYTQSKIISENIKWNLNLKNKKVNALMINARNANAFTGKKGYQGLIFFGFSSSFFCLVVKLLSSRIVLMKGWYLHDPEPHDFFYQASFSSISKAVFHDIVRLSYPLQQQIVEKPDQVCPHGTAREFVGHAVVLQIS